MYALVDCNNFYVSCERVFRPDLRDKPVLVLSNNDGCVVALSNECKQLGIHRGVPLYQIQEMIKQHDIAVFSSNYTLYGDMSNRVMQLLTDMSPDIEIYSIDEAFLDLSGFDLIDLESYARQLSRVVVKSTGIAVGIGVAPTKTLAKIAGHFAKKYPGYKGTCVIDNDEKRLKALKLTDISDVWGIGRRNVTKLKALGIMTAYDLTLRSKSWIQSKLTIVGVRLWLELKGTPCIEREDSRARKSICTSRSFGEMVSTYDELAESVAYFASRGASKLRKQHSVASMITVFIYTNRFREDLPQYTTSQSLKLSSPVSDSVQIVEAALQALRMIFREGYLYKKSGVILQNISSDEAIQLSLFNQKDTKKLNKISQVMDEINRKNGDDTVHLAVQKMDRNTNTANEQAVKWRLKEDYKSARFTTNLKEIIQVNAK